MSLASFPFPSPVPVWYRCGTDMLMYCTCMVPIGYQYGTGMVPIWYQYGTDMVLYGTGVVPVWYRYQ